MLAGILLGGIVGAVNGLLVVVTRINAFIVTLATMTIIDGLRYKVHGPDTFQNYSPQLQRLGRGNLLGLPNVFLVAVVVAVAVWFFFARTVAGRHLLASGGSPFSARLSGVSNDRSIVLAHTCPGCSPGSRQCITVALSGNVNASIGDDLLLPSFAAPIIGGVALAGGVVSVLGTCLAAFLVRLVDVAQAQFGINQRWVDLIVGAVVLGCGADRRDPAEARPRATAGAAPPSTATRAPAAVHRHRGAGAGRCGRRPDPHGHRSGQDLPGRTRTRRRHAEPRRRQRARAARRERRRQEHAGEDPHRRVQAGCRHDRGSATAEVHFGGPLDALRAGIGVVHQERNLVPEFSIAENVVLHHLPNRFGLVQRRNMRAEARRCLDLLDLDLDVDTPVSRLSVAQAQLVEIAKALSVDNRVLLLDEPTASLTGDEADRLYAIVRKLTATGHAVVLVSHKLEEVFAIADTVTVLRDGRSVAEAQPLAGYTRGQVVDLMVGRAYESVALEARGHRRTRRRRSRFATSAPPAAIGTSACRVRPGEILGLYGLVGAGRTELAKALLGLDRITGGDGAGARHAGPDPRRRRGAAHLPHRLRHREPQGGGPVPGADHRPQHRRDDLAAAGQGRADPGPGRARRLRRVRRRRCRSGPRPPRQLAGQLSGGNQQKVSLAKWLAADCDILIVDEPTVGIDVRTKAAFHELISEARRPWHGDPADLLGPAGDRDAGRPDRGDGRLRDRRRARQRPRRTTG